MKVPEARAAASGNRASSARLAESLSRARRPSAASAAIWGPCSRGLDSSKAPKMVATIRGKGASEEVELSTSATHAPSLARRKALEALAR